VKNKFHLSTDSVDILRQRKNALNEQRKHKLVSISLDNQKIKRRLETRKPFLRVTTENNIQPNSLSLLN
jgi:hypothetical protein